MLIIPGFKGVFCKSHICFLFVCYCLRYSGLVDDAFSEAVSFQWAASFCRQLHVVSVGAFSLRCCCNFFLWFQIVWLMLGMQL